jgi:hypothetical protein
VTMAALPLIMANLLVVSVYAGVRRCKTMINLQPNDQPPPSAFFSLSLRALRQTLRRVGVRVEAAPRGVRAS